MKQINKAGADGASSMQQSIEAANKHDHRQQMRGEEEEKFKSIKLLVPFVLSYFWILMPSLVFSSRLIE
jgi:hypothetical protein